MRRFAAEALRICQAAGDRAGEARAHQVLGAAANWSQEHDRAEPHLAEALAIRQELGDDLGVAETLYETAILAIFRGECDRAAAILGQILPLAAQAADARSVSYVSFMLGRAALGQGRLSDTRTAFRRALTLLTELADAWGLWLCLDGMSHLAVSEGAPIRALTLAAAAGHLRDTIGAPFPPAFRHLSDQRLAPARLALPDNEVAAAWAAGAGMDMRAASAYAAAGLGSA